MPDWLKNNAYESTIASKIFVPIQVLENQVVIILKGQLKVH